jgi:dihydropyrimidine dehydrogenase (NAD+) subunit PreT
MAEYSRPSKEEDLLVNFEQIHPLMDAAMAASASVRCLFCYDAPCIAACPSGIDIPMFIKQISSGNVMGAAKTIYSANYFGQICGKICPTEVLCEGACVLNEQDILPVEIGSLQTYACSKAVRSNFDLADLAKSNNKKIAVIGAGPAGIACACELRTLGYEVDVFEAKSEPSGLALHGTAPYKILNQEVSEELDYLREQFGFDLKLNHQVSDPAALDSAYSAIFLGIGIGRTGAMQIPGEDIEGNYCATEFIENVKLEPLSAYPGETVVVIGGGNTAMDAASESARLGAATVIIAYRRDWKSMSAYEFEFDLARKAGAECIFNVTPVKIIGDEKVTGVEFMRTKQMSGNIELIEDSGFIIECDAVIRATGQEKLLEFLSGIEGVQLDKRSRIIVDEYGQSGNPIYFAAGDAVNGGAEVVNAVAGGKKVAKGIDRWLGE